MQLGSYGREPLFLFGVGVVREVIYGKTRSVLHTLNREAQLGLDARDEVDEVVALLLDRLSFTLGGTGEIVQTDYLDALILIPVTDDREGVLLAHAELCAALDVGDPEQQRKDLASAYARVVDKLKVQGALGGEGAYVIIGGALNIGVAFVDAGEDDRAHIRAGALAYGEFAGRADLYLVKARGQSAEQKGISLDGKAQSYIVFEILFDQKSALLELIEVKDIRGGPYSGQELP